MEIQLWHILITLGIFSFIIEIFIPSFIAGSLGIGFFTAALGSYLNLEIKWIILMFSVGVLISFFGIRPLMIRYAYGKNINRIKTNYEGLIGKKGRVIEEIINLTETGLVKINGDTWKAESFDGQKILKDSYVIVESLKSTVLIVKQIK